MKSPVVRGFAVTEVSTFFTMPKRKTMRRKQRGGGLKEDALATLKDHGIKTDNPSLEHFAGTIGIDEMVKKGDYTYLYYRNGVGQGASYQLVSWKTSDHPHIDLTKSIPKPNSILLYINP